MTDSRDTSELLLPMWFDTEQMLKWLEEWHEQGCPTTKTLPRREEAGERLDREDARKRNSKRLWRKVREYEEIET